VEGEAADAGLVVGFGGASLRGFSLKLLPGLGTVLSEELPGFGAFSAIVLQPSEDCSPIHINGVDVSSQVKPKFPPKSGQILPLTPGGGWIYGHFFN